MAMWKDYLVTEGVVEEKMDPKTALYTDGKKEKDDSDDSEEDDVENNEELEEGAQDGHAAVIVAHTKLNKDAPKGTHGNMSSNAALYAKEQGKNLTSYQLKDLLQKSYLDLKSSHPDALKNLHANLMKVENNEELEEGR